MSKIRISFFAFIFAMFSIGAFAQGMDESMRTEASDPEDTSGMLDDIIDRVLMKEQRVLAYEPIREADILWEKRIWRVIDVREKMNIQFLYPQAPFFKILVDGALNGDIRLFTSDSFNLAVTGDKLDKLLHSVDTIPIYDPDTYQETIKIVKNDIDYNDIKKFRVKEIWYFDKEVSRIYCRILGIAPIKEERDESTGELKYEAPMFWIYYPQARKFLGTQQVFNEKNDIAPGTWSDLFDSRFFSSYIYKQSNVQDNRLQDIYKDGEYAGVNLLLESEKIKNELFNFEHDLWVY